MRQLIAGATEQGPYIRDSCPRPEEHFTILYNREVIYTALMTTTTPTTQRRDAGQFARREDAERSLLSDPRRIEVHDTVHIENVITGLPERYTIVPGPLPPIAGETWIDRESPLGSALIGRRTGEDVAFPALGVVFRYRVLGVMSPPRLRPVDASGNGRMTGEGRAL